MGDPSGPFGAKAEEVASVHSAMRILSGTQSSPARHQGIAHAMTTSGAAVEMKSILRSAAPSGAAFPLLAIQPV